jgi:phenylacetate-CoA ligase
MNQFYNPLFLAKVLKSYLLDIDRLYRFDEEALRAYQDSQVRKMLRFASKVPLYQEKYKEAGVQASDITGVTDLEKLPFISKDDIKHHYPTGIIASTKTKEQLVEVATSGTTGKSLPLYVDLFDIVVGLFAYVRTLHEYGMSIWKNRITLIGDFASHTAESGYITRGLQPRFNITTWFHNIQWLNTNDDPQKLIKEINAFRPEFIGGYVGMLSHLAVLKETGLGADISPEFIGATGSVLDPSLKAFIEQSFGSHVFEVYGATESGLIGFECRKGNFHLMSDLVYPEFLNKGAPVRSGEAGHLVITKLYGGGTPLIRYNAINDLVAPLDATCSCGMAGGLIKKIYGRDDLAIYVPDGSVLLASSFSEIYSKLLYELRTNKVKNTRVIQHDLYTVEIDVLIDETSRSIGPSVEEVCAFLKQGFQTKVGPQVTVTVKEVDAIDTRSPRIVSKVDLSQFVITGYR